MLVRHIELPTNIEKKRLEEELQQINRQLNDLPLTLEKETSKLRKKYATMLDPLRQNATLLRVEEEQMPTKRQDLQNQQHKLKMDEQEMIEQEKEVRERAFNAALLCVQAEKDERERHETLHKKELKELDLHFNRQSKEFESKLRAFQMALETETKARHEEFSNQKKQLEEQQRAELSGKGVDVNLLGQYRRAIEQLADLLQQIDKERPMVIRYRDAQQNLFAKEPEIRKDIKDIEQQVSDMRTRKQGWQRNGRNRKNDRRSLLKTLLVAARG